MNSMRFQMILFLRKFRGEVIITITSSVLSLVISLVLELVLKYRDPYLFILFFFGCMVALLIGALLFNQKRLIDNRFRLVNQVLIDYFGHSLGDNQFFRRRSHYAPEKRLLARVLVTKVLPRVVERICDENPNLTTLNIIIDSGTTLTPIFPELVAWGVPVRKKDVNACIYTNSMSGVEAIHKLAPGTFSALTERDINLLGGQPLNKYRATTGKMTQDSLQSLWNAYDPAEGSTITLSILTANWFLGGDGFNLLSICARGSGHLEFKSDVSVHSQYRILVAPLGKILQLNDVAELNELLTGFEGDEYRDHRIPEDQKNRTYLLTTRRSSGSLSPFRNISISLERIERTDGGRNYVLCEESPVYRPPGETFREVFANETPHRYVRENFEKAYGFSPWRPPS